MNEHSLIILQMAFAVNTCSGGLSETAGLLA